MRPISGAARRLRALAAVLTLLSGAVMMLAGYLGQRDGWILAAFITIPGGIVILAASALARRADRAGGQAGAPSRDPRHGSAGVTAATLLSGGTMVLAGYAGSAWGLGVAALLASVGGLVICVAFAGERRGMQAAAATPTSRDDET